MRKQTWTKRDPIKNYFPLPNAYAAQKVQLDRR